MLTSLLSLAELHGEKIWFVGLCFFSQQSLGGVEYNTFRCGCADSHGQDPEGRWAAGPHSLSWGVHALGREGWELLPPLLWAAAVSSPGKVKCLPPAALGSGQHSAEPSCALCQHCPALSHSFGPSCPAPARIKPHTYKTNSSLLWRQEPEEKNGRKNKPDLMTFVTHWQEHRMARGAVFKDHHPAAVGPHLCQQ